MSEPLKLASGAMPAKSGAAALDGTRGTQGSETKGATASCPTAWSPKGVFINLSRARREALLAFANASGSALTPAQALYSLIDLIAPAIADAVEEPSSAASSATAWDKETAAIPSSEGREAHAPSDRLARVERQVDVLSDTMTQCAQALEEMRDILAPMSAIIAELAASLPRAEGRPPSGSIDSERGLAPARWIELVAPLFGDSDPSTLVAELVLRKPAATQGDASALSFACSAVMAGERAFKGPKTPWPSLDFAAAPSSPLRLCLAIEPAAPIRAVFIKEVDGRWTMTARRAIGGGKFGPPLYRAA